MNLGLLAIGLALLAFPGLARRRSAHCPPAEWARVGTWAFLVGGLAVYAALVMTALPLAMHLVPLQGAVAICDPVVHRLMIGGPLVGWVAAILVVLASTGILTTLRRSRRTIRRARIERWLGDHFDRGDYDLVVVPTPALVAVGVPGDRPQVVVSDGLVHELEAARLDAVIGHEVAHHRLGHHRFLRVIAITEGAFRAFPFVGRSTRALRGALEAWADDYAVESTGTQRFTLRSVLIAFSCNTDHDGELAVATRTRRLLEPAEIASPAVRGLAYLPAGALFCGAAGFLAAWILASQHALALGTYC